MYREDACLIRKGRGGGGGGGRCGRGWRAGGLLLLWLIVGGQWLAGQPTTAVSRELTAHYNDFRRGAIDEAAFTNAVIDVSARQSDIAHSLQTLQEYRPQVKESQNSVQLYREIALLAEMSAQYNIALESYQDIVEHPGISERERHDTLFKIGALAFSNGDFTAALTAVQQVLTGSRELALVHRAYILQTRIEGYAVNFDIATQKLTLFIDQHPTSPALRIAYITLIELYLRQQAIDKAQRVQRILEQRFPASIEARYTYGQSSKAERIMSMPLLVMLLHSNEANLASAHDRAHGQALPGNIIADNAIAERNEQQVRVQVGSFQNLEYAQSLQGRLEGLGLQVTIDRSAAGTTQYHKIRVVTTQSRYSEVLATLSRHNISGFLVTE